MSNNSKNNIQPLLRGKIKYSEIEEDPINRNDKNNNITRDFQRNRFRIMGPMQPTNNNFERIIPNEGKRLYNPFEMQNNENKSAMFTHSILTENPFIQKKTEENKDQLKREENNLSSFEKLKRQSEERNNIMNNNKVPLANPFPFGNILFFE